MDAYTVYVSYNGCVYIHMYCTYTVTVHCHAVIAEEYISIRNERASVFTYVQ